MSTYSIQTNVFFGNELHVIIYVWLARRLSKYFNTITTKLYWFIALAVYALRWRLSGCQIKYPCRYCKPRKMQFSLPSFSSYFEEKVWPMFENEAQNNEPPIPKTFNTNTQAPTSNAKTSRKKNFWRPTCFRGKYGRFVSGWSPPKLLSTITRYVQILLNISWRKLELSARPFLSFLMV